VPAELDTRLDELANELLPEFITFKEELLDEFELELKLELENSPSPSISATASSGNFNVQEIIAYIPQIISISKICFIVNKIEN
jgi:hypothetical protein